MDARVSVNFMMRYLLAVACSILPAMVPPAAAGDPETLYRQGRFAEAEKAYAQADMDHPRDLQYRFNKGCAAFQAGNYEAAVAAFSSVLSRAEAERSRGAAKDEEILFRAGYNLGCAAFKERDYRKAVSGFKKALLHRPEHPEARHNLELALRELEKQKDGASEKPEPGPSKDRQDEQSAPSGSSQKGGEKDEKKTQDEDPDSGKQEGPGENQAPEGSDERGEHRESQDLSGDLKPRQETPDQAREGSPVDQASQVMDRNRAEALLDNVREDPARFRRHQSTREWVRGVPSGKDW